MAARPYTVSVGKATSLPARNAAAACATAALNSAGVWVGNTSVFIAECWCTVAALGRVKHHHRRRKPILGFKAPPVDRYITVTMLQGLTEQLRTGRPLSADDVAAAVDALVNEQIASEAKADFLSALSAKGETVEEIVAFARLLGGRSIAVPLDPVMRGAELLDVVGTGGDRLGTFNISTCAALVAASAGVRVAKHGNRAVTSKVGSADVIEALGLVLDQTPEQAAAALRERGFVFLFAPHYHPTFKHIAPARKLCAARGDRTIFNFLGPLLNPARPTVLLVGVPRPELCAPLAQALQQLGVRRGMVACGDVPVGPRGLPEHVDEFSTLGPTTVAEFYQDRACPVSTFDPACLPLQPATLTDLAGGDRAANARIVRQVLSGADRGPKRDAVLLNAGAALFVAGQVRSLAEGWTRSAELIDQGATWAKLQELMAAPG